jgi:hypothetical protein
VLHADALAERGGVATRVETEDGDGAAIGNAMPLDAFHRGGLAAPLGPIRPKISPSRTSSDTSSTATVRP